VSDFEADFEYLEDEELSANPAVNNIVSSYGTSNYGGLSVPELASSNFNGEIVRVIDNTLTANQATLGMSIYLDSNNEPVSTLPSDSDIAYQIVEKTTASGNTTFSVIKDGAVLELEEIANSTYIYLLRENWAGTTNFGDSGWAITAEGNSVFTNVYVRGNIEATSGFFGSDSSNGWNIGSSSLFGQSNRNKLSAYDPSFESSWENYWSLVTSTPSATLQSTSSPKFEGTSSLRLSIVNNNTSGAMSYTLSSNILDIATSSGSHTLSFYASSGVSHTATVTVTYYNSAGTQIGTPSTPTIFLNTTFNIKSVSLSLPADTAKIDIAFSGTTTSSFYPAGTNLIVIDAIQLEAGTSATTFSISSYIGLVPTEDIKIKVSSSATATPVFSVNSSGEIKTSGVTSSGNISSPRIRATATSSLSTTSSNHAFQIGSSSGLNMRFDLNDIQVLNNGSPTALVLNGLGGNVSVAPSGSARFGGSTGSTYPVEVDGTVNATAIRVSSQTRVDNLNAQYLNGNLASAFLRSDVSDTAEGTITFDSGIVVANNIGISSSTTFLSGGSWRPNTSSAADLGSSTRLWRDLYRSGSTFTSSDERLKEYIEDSDLGIDFINSLRPVKYKWKVVEEVVEGDEIQTRSGIRTHYGFIAQEVRSCVTEDFSGWALADKTNQDSPQMISYEEFISPMVKSIQQLHEMVSKLEERLAILEG
jgi:hypothetical protein